MIDGSLGFDDQRENEFNASMEDMKETFYKDYTNTIQETDEVDPYQECFNSSVVGGQPQYEFILHQLNQRRDDRNFVAEVRLIDPEDKMLAAYLAEYGANNWEEMVIIEEPFGRVEKLWHYDTGLCYYSPHFRAALRGEVNPAILVDEVVNPPPVNLNQNNNNEEHMVLGEDQNGMDLLADAVVFNGAWEVEAAQVEEMNEVVIGFAAVPMEQVGMMIEEGNQEEAQTGLVIDVQIATVDHDVVAVQILSLCLCLFKFILKVSSH